MFRINRARFLRWWRAEGDDFNWSQAQFQNRGLDSHMFKLLSISLGGTLLACGAFCSRIESSERAEKRIKDKTRIGKVKRSIFTCCGGFVLTTGCVFAAWRRVISARNAEGLSSMARLFTLNPSSSLTSPYLSALSHTAPYHLAWNTCGLLLLADSIGNCGFDCPEFCLLFASGVGASKLFTIGRYAVPDKKYYWALGASGGICGLAGAVAVMDCSGLLPGNTIFNVVLWSGVIAFEAYGMVFSRKPINHAGHVGGFLCGGGLGLFYLLGHN